LTEIKQDRWKRYKLPHPETGEEQSWTRVTTLAGALDDGFGLNQWKMRGVVLGLVSREDLLDLAYACDPEDKDELDRLCDRALDAARADQSSNRGTALHKFTARLDAGQMSRSPRQWQEHLDAYMAFKDEEGIQTHPRFIERTTVVPELGVAGTMDRIAKHRDVPKITDLKTGSIKYDGMKIHIQLAVYSRGRILWNAERSEWERMPEVSQDEGLVIHLPAERDKDGNLIPPRIYPVDLNLGWEMAKTALIVREWRKTKLKVFEDDAVDDVNAPE
jgi:hypothetical protein